MAHAHLLVLAAWLLIATCQKMTASAEACIVQPNAAMYSTLVVQLTCAV